MRLVLVRHDNRLSQVQERIDILTDDSLGAKLGLRFPHGSGATVAYSEETLDPKDVNQLLRKLNHLDQAVKKKMDADAFKHSVMADPQKIDDL